MGEKSSDRLGNKASLGYLLSGGSTELLAQSETAVKDIGGATGGYESTSEKKAKVGAEIIAAQDQEVAQASVLAQEEEDRKRRQSIFKTGGGSAGMEVMSVGSRGNLFGN
jgi:hypothetical protein